MAASTMATMKRIIVLLACLTTLNNVVSAFSSSPHRHNTLSNNLPQTFIKSTTQLQALSDEEEQELRRVEEESRLKILTDRRKTIRGILKAAEGTKNYRLQNGYVPAINEETGKPEKSDAQTAVTITAFVVAAGAVALRIGGRAALVSALGLDFATENPELRDGLDNVLNYASTIGTEAELGLFILAWTAVKVLCFDAGGVVLALASGVLFGGVWQGAVVSAFSATVGSSVAFGMAKLDTPVRTKALEVVEEYPSLRGIEKVVAKDGLKAILTLRLAPVLPIPIGLYNYVYGVTNVPYLDFAGGIFLGSLKPYLLDSYLGVFGKQLVDGTAGESGMQDALLLIALGVSVLIGVFASQLANETWESINEEVELEKKVAAEKEDTAGDGVMRQIMGMDLPQWIIGFQLSLQAADERVGGMIVEEYNAKVWNYTQEELELDPIINPAAQSFSPEVANANKGFDFPASICDGLVLSPNLLSAYFRYADPLYNEEEQTINSMKQGTESLVDEEASAMKIDAATVTVPLQVQQMQEVPLIVADDLLKALEKLQTTLQKQLADL
ncbi:TVP38/TMEM64 family membrane protein [Skeletonema marinoi]|uniref:TVP38/TMEM64 family membrane protein n=1 Tax=Skeletonema marinoi TaxID=267567 RepID=A0AAD9D721_9STRA|nr:TVP38/TMEM64 family membrane protein [Skeletonema marinoi]